MRKRHEGGWADNWAIAFTRIVDANPRPVAPQMSGWRVSSIVAIVQFSVGSRIAESRGWITGDQMMGAPPFWYRVLPLGKAAIEGRFDLA